MDQYQEHVATKRQTWDPNPGRISLEPTLNYSLNWIYTGQRRKASKAKSLLITWLRDSYCQHFGKYFQTLFDAKLKCSWSKFSKCLVILLEHETMGSLQETASRPFLTVFVSFQEGIIRCSGFPSLRQWC